MHPQAPCMAAIRRCRFPCMTMSTIRFRCTRRRKANELMAHCYAHLYRYRLPVCGSSPSMGLGRPDMRCFVLQRRFLKANHRCFNHGKMQRDFTYVDDIAEGVFAPRSPAQADSQWASDNQTRTVPPLALQHRQ